MKKKKELSYFYSIWGVVIEIKNLSANKRKFPIHHERIEITVMVIKELV